MSAPTPSLSTLAQNCIYKTFCQLMVFCMTGLFASPFSTTLVCCLSAELNKEALRIIFRDV